MDGLELGLCWGRVGTWIMYYALCVSQLHTIPLPSLNAHTDFYMSDNLIMASGRVSIP